MNILAVVLLGAGLLFYTGGVVGINRMPDFYSRLHPAGKLDTFGALMTMLGLAIYNIYSLEHFTWDGFLISLKILLIVVFGFWASPTATHSIANAGIRAGLTPWTKDKGKS